jgi:hypothetical protein
MKRGGSQGNDAAIAGRRTATSTPTCRTTNNGFRVALNSA